MIILDVVKSLFRIELPRHPRDAEAVIFLKKIATQEARRWGKSSAIEIKHFFQRLSIALQRGNATFLVERDHELSDIGV